MRVHLTSVVLGILFWTNLPFLQGQVDHEFWFVVPDIYSEPPHYPASLVISSIGTTEEVRISQPANPDFTPISLSLSPSEVKIVDLEPFLEDLENRPADIIQNKGVLIQASGPITAYFHAQEEGNQDIFTLKGRDALGKDFFIPGQTHFQNRWGKSGFDIVATEAFTQIHILPNKPIIGHAAGIPFTITLHEGQTFSCRALGTEGDEHLVGSRVQANKPVAITVFDDGISNEAGTNWDLAGDQLLPVTQVGSSYIAMKGDAATERVYCVATQAQTTIFVNGSNQATATLDAGESVAIPISQSSLYLSANRPFYAFHLSGYEDNPGGALLYPLECTGTDIVKYVRPAGRNFIKYLLTNPAYIPDLRLNGTQNIGSFYFSPEPNSPGNWSIGRVEGLGSFTTSTNQLNVLEGIFHMGMIATTGEGASYGYFSDSHPTSLSQTEILCEDTNVSLQSRRGASQVSWNTGASSPEIQVQTPGPYWYKGQLAGCPVQDSFWVEPAVLELGADVQICPGDSLLLDIPIPTGTLTWSDGITGATRYLKPEGIFTAVWETQSCQARDSLEVQPVLLPPLDLGSDTVLCPGERFALNLPYLGDSIVWQDGSTANSYTITQAGTYHVLALVSGCSITDTIHVKPGVELEAEIRDSTLCIGDTLTVKLEQANTQYIWDDGSEAVIRPLYESGIYTVYGLASCLSAPLSWELTFEDCSCRPFISNTFSPNQDGINDEFAPQLACPLAYYELSIYNRWGDAIFRTQDPEVGWQGQTGKWQTPETVYFYQLTYRSTEETQMKTLTGQILLMR